MAGDWIKMRGNLWDDPRVVKLCDLTECGEAQVIGGLYWLWATADQHSEDGHMPGLSLRAIDRKTGVPGLGRALCVVGWLVDHEDGVCIVKFDEHNGASAKSRASTAKRVAAHKSKAPQIADSGNAEDVQNAESGNAEVTVGALPKQHEAVSGALPREEKRREETKKWERASSPQPFARAHAREDEPPDKAEARIQALATQAVCGMQAAGLADAFAEDPELLALLRQGVTPAEVAEAAGVGVSRGKGKAWVFARVVGKRIDAAQPVALPQVSPGWSWCRPRKRPNSTTCAWQRSERRNPCGQRHRLRLLRHRVGGLGWPRSCSGQHLAGLADGVECHDQRVGRTACKPEAVQ